MPPPIAIVAGTSALAGSGLVVLAQTAIGSDATVVSVLGAAVVSLAGLVAWMVRQLMSGAWVRKEHEDISKQHAEAIEVLKTANGLNQRLIDRAFRDE